MCFLFSFSAATVGYSTLHDLTTLPRSVMIRLREALPLLRALVRVLCVAVLPCSAFCPRSTLMMHHRNPPGRHGVIVAREAAVRKDNGDSYALQLAQPLRSGTEFTVLETRGVWLRVRLENGAQGWIRRGHAVVW